MTFLSRLRSFPITQYILSFLQDLIVAVMKTGPIPAHVALVMDGNRTYAKKNNLPLKGGHSAGADSLTSILELSYRLGITCVTVYAFSIENFNRSKAEVDTLFDLLRSKIITLSDEDELFERTNVRLKVLGDRKLIPKDILESIERAESYTAKNDKHIFNVCFPYTSRDEIAQAIRGTLHDIESGEIKSEDLDVKTLNSHMYTKDSPPLDIMIRTSGHTRFSDFMLWQMGNDCTIEFVDTLWPEFRFWGYMKVLLKWSYYRTLEMMDVERLQTQRPDIQQLMAAA